MKPGLVGVSAPLSNADTLSWSPPDSERSKMVFVPVKAKNDLHELVEKASLYARALHSVSPMRRFALVIGYHHSNLKLRFLVFHSGDVTTSKGLSIQEVSDRKEILRLLLSILTWETSSDAGLPE
jgi:hypothetical protein